MQLNQVFLLRHVPSRCLTLQPAVVRIVDQWPALVSCFKKIVENDKSVEKNDTCICIRRLLDNPHTFIQLQFIADVTSVFSTFVQLFQREGPMIYVLHSALFELIQKLLLRFVKVEVMGKKNGKRLCEIDVNDVENMRTLETFEVEEATMKAVSTIKKSSICLSFWKLEASLVRLPSTCRRTSVYAIWC